MMISYDNHEEYEVENPILDIDLESSDNFINNENISNILKREMHLSEDLIILDKHDAMINLEYIYYIKYLINTLLNEGDRYQLGYFLFLPENLLLISVTSSTKLYLIEVPDELWKLYIPEDMSFN